MRPLPSSRSALAAVALCGAAAAGTAMLTRGPADHAPSTGEAADPATPAATPGFFAGEMPASLSPRAVPQVPPQEAPQRPPTTPPSDCPEVEQRPVLPTHEFYFTRAIYGDRRSMRGFGWGRRGRGSWSTDFPKADRQFMVMVDHLVNMDLFPCANAVRLDDPMIRRFPYIYALEVGGMGLSDAEVTGLRDYLYAGGFLVIDDFWGTYEWENFEREIRRVLPGRQIVEIPMDHPVFHTFYDIDDILQVPNQGQGRAGGPTHERDGYVPHVLGIFDDHDRLMVIINWNTDLGDAWEWAEDPYYPLKFSRFAAEMGINMIVYAMSH